MDAKKCFYIVIAIAILAFVGAYFMIDYGGVETVEEHEEQAEVNGELAFNETGHPLNVTVLETTTTTTQSKAGCIIALASLIAIGVSIMNLVDISRNKRIEKEVKARAQELAVTPIPKADLPVCVHRQETLCVPFNKSSKGVCGAIICPFGKYR